MYLSDQYAAATTGARRVALATAAEGLVAVSNTVNAAGILTALGILIILLVMLKGVVPYLGIATGVLGIVSEVMRGMIGAGYFVYGILLPSWFVAVAWQLYWLAGDRQKGSTRLRR